MAKTILLADDSVTIQKVVELTFMDEDFEVAAVGSGNEALEWLQGRRPDLVIADVHMPGADGYAVCEQAKARYDGLPVLLLVGTFEPFDEGRAGTVGADGHLKKPFDAQDLLGQVSRLTAGKSEPAAPPSAAGFGSHATRVLTAEDAAEVNRLTDPSTAQVDLADIGTAPVIEPPVPSGVPLETVAISTIAPEDVPPAPAPEPPRVLPPAPEPPPVVPQVVEAQPVADASDEDDSDPSEATAEIDMDTVAAARTEVDSRASAEAPASNGNGHMSLSDDDIERVARRVAELVADQTVREVAWEVVPDLAEVVIKERIRELESQLE